MYNNITTNSEFTGDSGNDMNIFLANVRKVYTKIQEIKDDKLVYNISASVIYNENKYKDKDPDVRFLGSIQFQREHSIYLEDYAIPFDKNNMTYPIVGETVLILDIGKQHFWLPFSNTQYPNYREDLKTTIASQAVEYVGSSQSNKNYSEVAATNIPEKSDTGKQKNKREYKVNEKIHFLQPRNGDTFITGRVGNTIRFSEFFLTEDGKTSSPGIFIRNKQNPSLNSKKLGELIDEDINKDGTSIYLTSGKIKVPFKETITKSKTAFSGYPSSGNLTGDQLIVNSDRIILSAKASEFIIFGKGNTGIITDGVCSIDAASAVYQHSDGDITLHTGTKIYLNTEGSGQVYLGSDSGVGDAGADVQQMVLGGELVDVLTSLIDLITNQVFYTPAGPSAIGPVNTPGFKELQGKLDVILSARNFLSKS